MSPQQVNQITAIVAIVLIVILFLLVSTGTIPALVAIVLTLGIGLGVRFLRRSLIKP
jgi:hypothetical protein